MRVLGSIVVSIPACHAGDRGSIPRRGDIFLSSLYPSTDLVASSLYAQNNSLTILKQT